MLLDATRFPLVFLRDGPQHPTVPLEALIGELLDRGEPFVLLTDHLPGEHHHEEGHEDRKQRALFFKRNKARMRALCRGLSSPLFRTNTTP